MSDVLGYHYLAEYHSCDISVIDSESDISEILLEAARVSGATIIDSFFHSFSPQGVSGVIVIAESHISIHTWPEHGYAAVDLFSCGDFDYQKALDHIGDGLVSEDRIYSVVERGNLAGRNVKEVKAPVSEDL